MELYKTTSGQFIAKTIYGEWDAKNAGFRWDRINRHWVTTNEAIATGLSAQAGIPIVDLSQVHVPTPAPQGDLWPSVREGRYAIVHEGVLKFYQVDKPVEGKWAGYTFLRVMASDDAWPIKDRAQKKLILDTIAADPMGALARYGQEIGKCGHCGRTLTDAESRQIGIGPVCRGKLGL